MVASSHLASSVENESVHIVSQSEGDTEEIGSLFDLEHVRESERHQLRPLLEKYKGTFSTNGLNFGGCDVLRHIVRTTNAAPVYQKAILPARKNGSTDSGSDGRIRCGAA